MHIDGKHSNDNSPNDEIFKDKVVLNQSAGSIEFINTKDSESIEITHKTGSHYRLDKFGTELFTTRDKREHIAGDSLLTVNGGHAEYIDENVQKVVLGDSSETVGDADKWQLPMENIKKEQRELHDMKRLFEVNRTNGHNSIDQSPNQKKIGFHAPCPTDKNVSKILETTTASKVVMDTNSMPRQSIINISDNVDVYSSVVGGGANRCLTCWGKMISPSTQDGLWTSDQNKAQIAKKREEVQKKIYEHEKELGQNKCPNGGNSIRTIAKNFIENIGLVFNDFESYRKDPHGKLVPCGVKIDPLGTTIYTQYRETALIEHVDVEKLPGGSYDLNICDGWNVTVGANGIDFTTCGPLNLFGTSVNLIGEHVTVGSKSEVSISGERIDLHADVISIRPKKLSRDLETGGSTSEEQQLLIDGNLNVGINAIIRGGLHVEGEITAHHITAPCEYQITETDFTWGTQIPPVSIGDCVPGKNGVKDNSRPDECATDFPKSPTFATLLPGAKIGYAIGYDSAGNYQCLDVYSVYSENFAQVDSHVHYFKNLPLKLFQNDSDTSVVAGPVAGAGVTSSHNSVRAVGARNNWPKPVLSHPVVNSKTENTVINKFSGDKCSTLSVNNTDWVEKSQDDSLPDGEGVRTKNYTDVKIRDRIKILEADLEAKYVELKAALANLSQTSDC